MRRQRDRAAHAGRPVGGRRAYGFEADNVTVRPDEAAMVREVADRLLGGDSLRTIAFDLNRRTVPTCSGSLWSTRTLQSMIANPRYAGLRVHRGEVVGDAVWPAILDRATHERVRAVVGDARRVRRGRPSAHLLTGFVRCGWCGGKMHSSRDRNEKRRFICSPGPQGGCGHMSVVAEPLEQLVEAAVLQRLRSPVLNAARAKASRRTKKATDVGSLAELERDLEDLARDYGEQRITRREWLAAREPLERRRDTARRALAAHADRRVLETMDAGDVAATWDKLPLERRRAVLTDRIVINTASSRGHVFESDRVDVVWRA
jgi:hypothetical protein